MLGFVLVVAAGCALVLTAGVAPSQEARRQARVVLAAIGIVVGLLTAIFGSVITIGVAKDRRDEAVIVRFLEAHVEHLAAWRAEQGAYPRELTELGLGLAPPPDEFWIYGTNDEGSLFSFELPGRYLSYHSDTREWWRGS